MNEKLVLAPCDEQLEQAVLGAMLIGGSIDDVSEVLSVEDWYFRKHQVIFSAMCDLNRRNESIDYLTLGNELEKNGFLEVIGEKSYLAQLMTEVASPANMRTHAKAIRELALLRGLMRIGQDVVFSAESKQPAEQIAHDAEHRLFTTMWARQVRPWKTASDVVREAVAHVEIMQQRSDKLSGITTGLIDLDAKLGGWQPTDLVIVAARPSMGKTAFMCGAVLAAAKSGKHVAISSLEMSTRQLGIRMVALEARVDVFMLSNGRLTFHELSSVIECESSIAELPISMDDSGIMTVDKLRAKARQLKVKGKLDVLFVDYLQLMEGRGKRDGRQMEVSEISRGLKVLAKELNITVIALSQLSRKCEEREDKRPILSDLRESGAIEQDADIVIGLYRDDVYHKESADSGIAEMLVRKHRNGPIGDVRVAFIEQYAAFHDLARNP